VRLRLEKRIACIAWPVLPPDLDVLPPASACYRPPRGCGPIHIVEGGSFIWRTPSVSKPASCLQSDKQVASTWLIITYLWTLSFYCICHNPTALGGYDTQRKATGDWQGLLTQPKNLYWNCNRLKARKMKFSIETEKIFRHGSRPQAGWPMRLVLVWAHSASRSWRYWCSTMLNHQGNLSMCGTFLIRLLIFSNNRG